MGISPTGVFSGFNLNYRTYTVITPQTGITVNMRGLTVDEVDELRHSSLVPNVITKKLNKIIYGCIQDKTGFAEDLDTFKKSFTIADREALLYGIYHATFGKKDLSFKCGYCGTSEKLKLDLGKAFSFVPYPYSQGIIGSYKADVAVNNTVDPVMDRVVAIDTVNKANEISSAVASETTKKRVELSILTRIEKLQLPESGVFAYIKEPLIADEERVLESIPFIDDKTVYSITESLPVVRMEQVFDDGSPSIIITDYDDIIKGVKSLVPEDKEFIDDKFQEFFGKYCIDIKSKYECQNCKNVNSIDIDIISQFFRMVRFR